MAKKDDKIYEESEIEFNLISGSRKKFMSEAVEAFISEKPGYWKNGKKHVTRFRYYVETAKDGRRVFLKRPTHLNKGIDFQVWVEKFDGVEDRRPKHQDIFDDLILKKKEKPEDILKLLQAIDRVWNCEQLDEILKDLEVDFKQGFPVDLLLKILKWLFIEQDITYWNYDGRGMLRMAIDKTVEDFEFTKKFIDSPQETIS